MNGQPGAFVEDNGTIMPDANDKAMAAREHTGQPATASKAQKGATKEVKTNAED